MAPIRLSTGVESLILTESKLRTTMGEKRLEVLLFCAAEKDLLLFRSSADMIAKLNCSGG